MAPRLAGHAAGTRRRLRDFDGVITTLYSGKERVMNTVKFNFKKGTVKHNYNQGIDKSKLRFIKNARMKKVATPGKSTAEAHHAPQHP